MPSEDGDADGDRGLHGDGCCLRSGGGGLDGDGDGGLDGDGASSPAALEATMATESFFSIGGGWGFSWQKLMGQGRAREGVRVGSGEDEGEGEGEGLYIGERCLFVAPCTA